MSDNKKVKPVAFHKIRDAHILEFLETVNFSGYMKELILVDMERRSRAMEMKKRTAKMGIEIRALGSNTTFPTESKSN